MSTISSRLFARARRSSLVDPTWTGTDVSQLPEPPAGWSTVDDATVAASYWNTVGTLAVGGLADIDQAGAVFPRWRECAVSVWFGVGDRWVLPQSSATQQTRLGGMPVLETKVRVGSHGDDVTMRTWADEPGDGLGRVVVEVENTASEAVTMAVAIQPYALTSPGTLGSLRVSGQRVVADGLPLVEFERQPADGATAVMPESLFAALEARLAAAAPGVEGLEVSAADNASASIVVAFPLVTSAKHRFFVVDGREDASVAAAPVEHVVSGWQTHLSSAAEITLPTVPKHLPVSAIAGLTMATPGIGSEIVALAASDMGLGWVARQHLVDLLISVSRGQVSRARLADIGIVVARLSSRFDIQHDEMTPFVDAAITCLAEVLESDLAEHDRVDAVAAIRMVAGAEAAADAERLVPKKRKSELTQAALLRTTDQASANTYVQAAGAHDPTRIARSMVERARGRDTRDFVVPMRASAGATWRWSERVTADGAAEGDGDSITSRAALLIGMSELLVCSSLSGLDLVPGFTQDWLGRNLEARNLVTRSGVLSFALRWHGERPALLWEVVPHGTEGQEFVITCSAIDPLWSTGAVSGEVLLDFEAPAGTS